MIKITKEQAQQIREKLPHEQVTMTNRQSKSRARTYYVSESYAVTRLLREIDLKKNIQHYE